MYVGRIPADLFHRLRVENLIKPQMTEMGSGANKVRDVAWYIEPQAMQVLQQYFEKAK